MSADNTQRTEGAVLACIDGSSILATVCDYAAWAAATIEAPLRLFHATENSHGQSDGDLSGAIGVGSRQELMEQLTSLDQQRGRLLMERGSGLLDEAEKRVLAAGFAAPERSQRHGSLTEALVALENETRMVVVGIHGEAKEREKAGVGEQIEGVLRALHRPVLVVNTAFVKPERVMLAFNGSRASRLGLKMVARSKLFRDCVCHVVYVGSDGQALLDEASNTLEAAGIETVRAQLEGTFHSALAAYQTEHDVHLTLMGAFSHSRIRGFLVGSFTAKMLAATERPLLLLR